MITLTLIVPMYNEGNRINKCIRALRSCKPPREVVIDRVIFVSDGSYDNTVAKIRNQISKIKNTLGSEIEIIHYKENKGRGYALRKGMKKATGDYALWFDADMSTPLSEINRILPHLQKGVPIVVGSRKINGARISKRQPLYRILLGQGFSKLSEIILGVPVGDFTCGFKVFSRSAYTSIFPRSIICRWGNDCETLFLAKLYSIEIHEHPVHWRDDPRTKVRVLHDICRSFADLLQIRINYIRGVYSENRNIRAKTVPLYSIAYEQA